MVAREDNRISLGGDSTIHERVDRAEMIDLIEADVVEVTVDAQGKLWVNVEGKCLLRVGRCASYSFETPTTKTKASTRVW